jgi:hypothetical protein
VDFQGLLTTQLVAGSGDVYSGYVAASKPRTGIQAIKDYFTGNAYDYGYQRSFGKDLTGIGGLLLGAINPALGLAFKGYQTFKPELNLLGNSPTISAYLNNRKNLYAPDTINYKSIYTPPGGINNIRTNPNIINPNTIPDLNDPFYSNMLYAEAPANDIKNQFAYVTEQDIARRDMQLAKCKKLIMKLQKILV